MRKFRINNYMKGRIKFQMEHLIESGAIEFEKVNRNTGVVVIHEDLIDDKYELEYIYRTLIPMNREIKS